MKLIKYFLVAIIFTISVSTFTLTAEAVDTDASTNSLNFTPEISIPGQGSAITAGQSVPVGKKVSTTTGNVTSVVMRSDLLGKYIQALYNYGLAIVAILATIVLMGGGLIWLTSGGDSGKINQAKEMIIGSITGTVILFCAWIILNTVNPALLEFKPIDTTLISKVVIGCCDKAKDDGNKKMTDSSNCAGTFYADRILSNGKCEALVCCEFSIAMQNEPLYTRCFNTFPQTCSDRIALEKNGSYNSATGFMTAKNCSELAECQTKGNTFSCVGVLDGRAPSGDSALRCYSGIIYSGDNGQPGEPCGFKSDGYGICMKNESICHDKVNLGLGGGRSCGDSLKCCLD